MTHSLTLEPGLYVTATPIGNLKDMTHRAIRTMKAADLILCEDTRQTAKLCAAYEIKTRRAPYHEHNADQARPDILRQLTEGAVICLVSDAGTPLISDPGYKLVRAVRDAGLPVFSVPGPSALTAALSIAGAPSDRFLFAGFPPTKQGARLTFFAEFANINASLVFYETAPRLSASLADMATGLGNRKAAIAREVTKKFEEVLEGPLEGLSMLIAEKPVKGEIVVIVHPPERQATTPEDLDAFLTEALASMSVKDAANAAADALKTPKREAYERALTLKNQK